MIDSDIKKAKEHLDFSGDFPFESHDTPINDLKSIAKSIEEGKMPPKKYLFMHSGARLNKDDKNKIKNWIEKSLKRLKWIAYTL